MFGGKYRIIDFVLNNFVNSGIFKIKVLTQFKADSLIRHITSGWGLSNMLGQYVDPVPAQMRTGKSWYQGTADAIYQNLNLIDEEHPDYLAVFGADHIYKMDISTMLNYHIDKGAVATIAAIPKPVEKASAFGVIEVNEEGKMIGFQEKPDQPREIPGNPGMCLCSMGNYIFSSDFIYSRLVDDAKNETSSHDFGKDIIPSIYKDYPVYVYNFGKNVIPGESSRQSTYWEDVGTIEAYYNANMTLRDVIPEINLYNEKWPIRTKAGQSAPSKFVFGSNKNDKDPRIGYAIDSIVAGECIISGSEVLNSVLSRGVRVHSYSRIDSSILFPDVEVGDRCKIKNAIIDRQVVVPPGTEIGYDLEKDRERYFVSESGIVIVSREKGDVPY
ncbi:MAG: glucose-1-phosphate adenylyltransferase, partial [Fibrobacterota bacterium]